MLRRIESLALWILTASAVGVLASGVLERSPLQSGIGLAFVLTAGALLFLHHHNPEE